MEQEPNSDNEVFFGPITLQEIKMSLGLPKDLVCKRQLELSTSMENVITSPLITEEALLPTETQSQPNLRADVGDVAEYSPISNDSPLKTSDEGFLNMEKLVTKLCLSPHTTDNCELNNTGDIVNYILHGEYKNNLNDETEIIKQESPNELNNTCDNDNYILHGENKENLKDEWEIIKQESPNELNNICDNDNYILHGENKENLKDEWENIEQESLNNSPRDKIEDFIFGATLKSPVNDYQNLETSSSSSSSSVNLNQQGALVPEIKICSPEYLTPAKLKTDTATPLFKTPISRFELPSNSVMKTPVFKTPSCHSVMKKATTPRNTLAKSYAHVASPIANYIRNSPQHPKLNGVHPKKSVTSISAIPKPVKYSAVKIQGKNKENVNISSMAYKNAKLTKVMQVPDVSRPPQSHLAKTMASSSTPKVLKHGNRKINHIKNPSKSNLEDSMANLSVHQADVSLCTQKTTFKSVTRT